MAASLDETAGQAEAIAASTEQLVSSVNEMAASIEQVTANTASLASSATETAAAIEETATSIQTVTTLVEEMASSAQDVTTSIAEMAASVKSVSHDTESLTSAVAQTGAAIEEMAQSIKGVSGNADDLAAAAEETSSSINEMAASIEEVGAMTERLATAVEQNSTAIEQMSRSVQAVAQTGRRITEVAGDAATSATEMERSSQAVAGLARKADEVTGAPPAMPRKAAAIVQRSIKGIARLRDSMAQSAGVMREMGKRTSDISSIVDTINLIAERTNLLSLNASIEAARAGDAGRGFAVVAEEIRNLADRSAKATADIAGIIKALQEVAQDAVARLERGPAHRRREQRARGSRRDRAEEDSRRRERDGRRGGADRPRHRGAASGGADGGRPPIAATTSRPGRSPPPPPSRSRPSASIVQATGADAEDRAGSHQGGRASSARVARHHQGRAEHDQARGRGAQGDGRAGQERGGDQPGGRFDAPRRGDHHPRGRRAGGGHRADCQERAPWLARQAVQASKAIAEQATAMSQIAVASASMRQQTGEAAKALTEQSRAMKEIAGVAASTARQIKQISRANREHSSVSPSLLTQLEDVRRITERNAAGVKETRGTLRGCSTRRRRSPTRSGTPVDPRTRRVQQRLALSPALVREPHASSDIGILTTDAYLRRPGLGRLARGRHRHRRRRRARPAARRGRFPISAARGLLAPLRGGARPPAPSRCWRRPSTTT